MNIKIKHMIQIKSKLLIIILVAGISGIVHGQEISYGSIHDFQQVIPDLANHFRVIAVDSPGHGRSEQADSLSFELMADYISEMIDKLQLDSVYIVGYSDGGIIALLLASRQPGKVKRVIASGANSKMSGIVPQILEYLNMVNPEFIETYQQEWLTDYQSKSPEKENWKKFVNDMTRMYSGEEIISGEQLSGIDIDFLQE
jgi:pimeloyl-ACP methyl ester carboxylesterase